MARPWTVAAALAAGLCLACLSDARAATRFEAPPGGIVPVAVTLDQVLSQNEQASGAEPVASTERWSFSAYGMRGTESDEYRGDDYREATTLGPFSFQRGRSHGRAWRQNANGLTQLLSSVRDRDAISAAALRDARRSHAGVRLLGESVARRAYVVAVSPAGGRRQWIFFDKATNLVTRGEFAFPDRRVTIVADDFRDSDGIVRAWHLHATDSIGSENDVDWKLEAFDPKPDPATLELNVPANDRVFDEFPDGASRVQIPARFLDSHVIVRLSVGGRPLDFLLDSGTSDIVIDREVARSLGLTLHGRSKNVTAGAYVQSQVLVPEIRVGRLTLHDVAAYGLPFSYRPAPDVHVVGMLGYDFISDAVIHVDYFHRHVEAIAYDAFRPERLRNASQLNVTLDDGVPVAHASIGGAGGRFIVDTGSVETVVFSRFAREHPAEVADAGGGAELRGADPYFSAGGVGGKLKLVPTQIRAFTFAGNVFRDFIVERVRDAPSFEVEDADGLIGYQFLHYFDVFFDYRHSRLILVPNPLFNQASQGG